MVTMTCQIREEEYKLDWGDLGNWKHLNTFNSNLDKSLKPRREMPSWDKNQEQWSNFENTSSEPEVVSIA